ncbi:MAG: mersacidin/lichenicidin family type 2 lantibiotic [Phycicoccus sp.]
MIDIVKSWKDSEYRRGLAQAPDHPSGNGLSSLTDAELTDISGAGTGVLGTLGCCWCLPWYSGWTVCGVVCDIGQPCA